MVSGFGDKLEIYTSCTPINKYANTHIFTVLANDAWINYLVGGSQFSD
jgi:hypothetical protein